MGNDNCALHGPSINKSDNHAFFHSRNSCLRLLSLNVCGLVSKLNCPDFLSLIREYDIIGLQETKTDDVDTYLEIPGYEIIFHNRKRVSRYRSGGIVLIAKKELVPFITIDEFRSSQLVLFFTISKIIYGENMMDDLICGIVYIPPHGSTYASPDPYFEIQEELTRFCGDSKHVLLFGDFNSRCKDLADYTEIDDFISDTNGMQDLYEENINILACLSCLNIPLNRKSAECCKFVWCKFVRIL